MIEEAIARTLTLCACADAIEREDGDEGYPDWVRDFHPGSGGDWDDSIPDGFPPEALEKAKEIARDFEERNDRTLLESAIPWVSEVYVNAEDEGGFKRFGHCVAMMALGHGVGLTDDLVWNSTYDEPEVRYVEFGDYDFDLPGFLQGK